MKAAAAAAMPWWKRAVKSIGDVFVPILPAIVASGLMMGLVEALGKAVPGFDATPWYGFLDMALIQRLHICRLSLPFLHLVYLAEISSWVRLLVWP